MLVYFAVMLVGMSVYGVDAWVRNADAFGVLFSLLGARGRGAAEAGVAGTMLLLIVAIGSTAFDGAREASGFATVADALAGHGHDGRPDRGARAVRRARRRDLGRGAWRRSASTPAPSRTR